jgi:ferredoxin
MGAWNLKGLVHSEDRARIAPALPPNLLALSLRLNPAITLVDALVVMEGDGPNDGAPVRFGRLLWGGLAQSLALLTARLLGYTPEEVPHLWHALREGDLAMELLIQLETRVQIEQDLRRPPARRAARYAGQMMRGWMQRRIHSRSEMPLWRPLATWSRLRTRIDKRDDTLSGLKREPQRCAECHRCEAFCPVGLVREDIGATPSHSRCIECLYCFQVCDRGALTLTGEGGVLLERFDQDRPFLVAM